MKNKDMKIVYTETDEVREGEKQWYIDRAFDILFDAMEKEAKEKQTNDTK